MRFRYISIMLILLLLTCFYMVFNRNSLKINSPLINNTHPKGDWYKSHQSFNIALVVCGHRLQESLVMIKSVLLFNKHDRGNVHFWIFSEDKLISEFVERLNDWRNLINFGFDVMPLTFPKHNQKEWQSLFKPCSSQRLFLPKIVDSVHKRRIFPRDFSFPTVPFTKNNGRKMIINDHKVRITKTVLTDLLLPEVDSVLYVDTDVVFLSPISDIWEYFRRFNASQFAALTSEHEDENIGWYNRFARHPFYGRMGVNSGVMLMNLTRMRIHNWVSHIVPIYNEYKLRITWGDQDIINVFFYYNPDALLLLPCQYNYRPDHCMYVSVCNVSIEGIKMMHANRGYFHSNKQPLFKAVYETVESYKLASNPYYNFLLPLKASLNESLVKETNCGLLTEETMHIANRIFGRYQMSMYD